MSKTKITCPECNTSIETYRNPYPTVDIIIEIEQKIVLIKRKNPPFGWALPGGFVDYCESLETAAIREAKEETSLDIENLQLLGCYSDPARDSRMHTISTVYIAQGSGTPCAADDAIELALVSMNNLPDVLCFDHAKILSDYAAWKTKATRLQASYT